MGLAELMEQAQTNKEFVGADCEYGCGNPATKMGYFECGTPSRVFVSPICNECPGECGGCGVPVMITPNGDELRYSCTPGCEFNMEVSK